MAFRPVSRLVVASRSYWRLASRLVSRPVLAFRSCFVDWRLVSAFRLSCRRWRLVSRPVSAFCFSSRVGVLCCRAFRVGVVLLRRFCQLVFPCRLVFSRRCCCSLCALLVVRVGWRRAVVALRWGGSWLPWGGRYGCCVAICDARRRGVGRFGDAVSCGVVCGERDVRRDVWRDEGTGRGTRCMAR